AEPLQIRVDAARVRLVATAGREDSPREFAAESGRLLLAPRTIARAQERARRARRAANKGRAGGPRGGINGRTRHTTSRDGPDGRTGAPLMDADDMADLRRELRTDPAVRSAVAELWPILTPQQVIGDLWSDPSRLAAAAPRMAAADRAALARAPGTPWTPAD